LRVVASSLSTSTRESGAAGTGAKTLGAKVGSVRVALSRAARWFTRGGGSARGRRKIGGIPSSADAADRKEMDMATPSKSTWISEKPAARGRGCGK
jgi:hypothetical protein